MMRFYKSGTRTGFPFINYTLIALNIAIFLYILDSGTGINTIFREYGLIPSHIFTLQSYSLSERTLPFLSYLFLHGGWAHLLWNTLFLYIFGAKVENRMGHMKYLAFYLICGVIAGLFQVVTHLGSDIPTVGASGAISAVLAAFLTFFPRSKITLVPNIFSLKRRLMPAAAFILLWFIIQFLGVMDTVDTDGDTGGVAIWAHLGGFVAGIFLSRHFQQKLKVVPDNKPTYYH